jgi:hypothetical protein
MSHSAANSKLNGTFIQRRAGGYADGRQGGGINKELINVCESNRQMNQADVGLGTANLTWSHQL